MGQGSSLIISSHDAAYDLRWSVCCIHNRNRADMEGFGIDWYSLIYCLLNHHGIQNGHYFSENLNGWVENTKNICRAGSLPLECLQGLFLVQFWFLASL